MPRTSLEHLVGGVAAYEGPPDRPEELPVVRPASMVTDIFSVGGRTIMRTDNVLTGLENIKHGAVLLGASVGDT